VKKFGNTHLVDRRKPGMTNWLLTTLRHHRWFGIGIWGYTPVGITGVLVDFIFLLIIFVSSHMC